MIVSDNFLFFSHFAKFGILKVFGGNFEILVFWTLARDKKFVKNVKGNKIFPSSFSREFSGMQY